MKSYSFIIFVVISVILGMSGLTHADLNDGLVAYYPFNGNAFDESGYGNHGTVDGATLTENMFGTASSAYRFDGNAEIRISHDSSLFINSDKSYSMSAWINTSASQNGNIFSNGEDSNFINVYRFGVLSDGHIIARLRDNSTQYTGGNFDAVSSKAYNDNTWHHVVVVADSMSLNIFVDGQPDGTVDISSAIIGEDPQNNFAIGSDSDNESFFIGLIDELRIYNRALSNAEIQELYSTNVPVDLNEGLIAHYPFDGTADDLLGNFDAQVHGATPAPDRFGNSNGAFNFDGLDDFIRAENFSLTTSEISISVWANNYDIPAWYRSLISLHSGEIGYENNGDKDVSLWLLSSSEYLQNS